MNSSDPIEVLLVEDNPADARLLQEALETTASETTLHFVESGTDAMDFLTQRGGHEEETLPDIVFLDLGRPGKDGCAVLERIRNTPEIRFLPVIVLTSSDAEKDIARCYDTHANACLTKPVDSTGFFSLAEAVERFWFERVQLPPVPA